MIKIDNLEKEYLTNKINSLTHELQVLEQEQHDTIFLETLLQKDDEQLKELANKYSINEEDILKTIYRYRQCQALSEESAALFSKTIKASKIQINKIVLKINDIINTKLNEKLIKMRDIQFELYVYNALNNYIYRNDNNVIGIINLMDNLSLDEKEKVELSKNIALKKIEISFTLKEIKKKAKRTRNAFDEQKALEQKKSKNYELVLSLIEEYKDYFRLLGFSTDINDLALFVDDDELNEIDRIDYINQEDLICYLYSLITKIRDCNKEEKNKYVEIIDYIKNNFLRTDILSQKDKLLTRKDYLETLHRVINEDIESYGILLELMNKLKKDSGLLLSRKLLEYIYSIIRDNTEEIVEEVVEKKPIKSFIVFDYNSNNEPYIKTDLKPENYTNRELFGDDLEKAISEMNKTLIDLIFKGDMESVLNSTSSVSDNSDKLVDIVYRDENKTKKTEMRRIKPTRKSAARVIERKYVIHHNTKLYEQFMDIIKELLPNAEININEDFIFYIVYVTTFKLADKKIYKEAIKRYDRSKLKKFIERIITNKNKGMNDKDKEQLREIIKDSIDSIINLDKETNIESPFDFSKVNNLCDIKKTQREMN